MKKAVTFLFFFVFLSFTIHSYAQSSDSLNEVPATEMATKPVEDISEEALQPPTVEPSGIPMEFWHSLSILIFGILIIGIEVYLIIKDQIKAQDVMKYIIVTLIITCVMFLITAGHHSDQIAPAMGLLGTIAGYLLGKGGNDKKETEKTSEAS